MKKILKIFLVFSLGISTISCGDDFKVKTQVHEIGEEKADIQRLDSIRRLLNNETSGTVYATPIEQGFRDEMFDEARDKVYPYTRENGKQLWAIWYDNYTAEGNTLLEDYKHNRNYIIVLSKTPPNAWNRGALEITDINGTVYHGFKIALRLE